MEWTNVEKAKLYVDIRDNLTTVAAQLEGFLESHGADAEPSEAQLFTKNTRDRLLTLIGNFAVRAKRFETEE